MNNQHHQSEGGEVSERILARIKGEGIAPRPRWHFLAQESGVWALGTLSVFVGGLAVAALLFEIRYAWWDYYAATHDSLAVFVVDALPFVWLVAFGVFAYAAYIAVRYTKRGYRYAISTLLLVSLVASALLGVCLYAFGLGQLMDEDVGHYIPLHQPLIDRERTLWDAPHEGRVAGRVLSVDPDTHRMHIQDINGAAYVVDLSGFTPEDRWQVRAGDYARVVGTPFIPPAESMGCILLMKGDDILKRAHRLPKGDVEPWVERDMSERKILLARTTVCKDVAPYMRLFPQAL